MRIISLSEIQSLVTYTRAIDKVREAFIASSNGLIEQPVPMQILFTDENKRLYGDCHVKAARQQDHSYFVIKVATGFYNNDALGLKPNNGLVLIMSAESGQPIAILQDEGWLTQLRTAAAGTLAAALKPVSSDSCLGIVGTGTQAYLQAKFITRTLGLKRVAVFGRDYEKCQLFCQKLSEIDSVRAKPMPSVKELCNNSSIVVTTTPSTEPIIGINDLPKELHIVAVGADSPGKNEVAASVLAQSRIIVTDSHEQCLHHGDFGVAVRAGLIKENSDYSFGEILMGKHPSLDFAAEGITLVDLTGIGAQDLSIASLVLDGLNDGSSKVD